jgi:hypothetical protein
MDEIKGTSNLTLSITLDTQLFDERHTSTLARISYRIAKGINPEIIIGNHTYRDLDLSRHYRHLFKPVSEENLTNYRVSHEKQDEASNLDKSASSRNPSPVRSRRSKRLYGTGNLQPPDTDLLVETLNERTHGEHYTSRYYL